MEESSIKDKIRLKQLQIQIEKDPTKKAELNKQLRKLQLRKEIEGLNKNEQNSS